MIAGRDSLAGHFTSALAGDELHVAAHSHHPWPDITREAHLRSWELAVTHLDRKWATVLADELPRARGFVAGRLGLADPDQVVFAQNTHELLMRICSGIAPPMRVLTTDAEFHSANRQLARWAEAGLASVDRVPVEPLETFPARFTAAMSAEHDLVLFSHVFYNSGYVVPDLEQVVAAVPNAQTIVIIDGYHAFMALPTDLSGLDQRAFYLAGGYKYAMAGEGACFASAPAGYVRRPVNTGWFAEFDHLSEALRPGPGAGAVSYADGGERLAGSTFDPTGLLRFNAVQQWLDDLGVSVEDIHTHVTGLQESFIAAVQHQPGVLQGATLIPAAGLDRGHFLTYRTAQAGQITSELAGRGVIVDHRGDLLRIGFGVYHELNDVEALVNAFRTLTRCRE
ncbi:MAG TPA: aminotransferase class V-fold PLP-dependent enzyme [Beutenbergiaceae bacterium]|nr:aminotransferase class V-fold PLP-dependent enzyme [Beutenbergiaceae bacterium]